MRQWGIALHGYLGELANVMPDEGRSGLNHLDGAWYNELPPYANAAAYRDIYDGDSLGPGGGYADSWIWYCPERILVKKNSGSGKNSYHYAINGVLNGHGTDEFGGVMNFLPDYGSDGGRFHTSADLVPAHSLTPFLAEIYNNVTVAYPDAPSGRGGNLQWDRHQQRNGNMLFLDAHVGLLNTTASEAANANRVETSAAPYRRTNPTIVWGPFP